MKLRITMGFVAAFISALTLLAPSAKADDINFYTRGEVSFVAGTGPVNPLDPDMPDVDLENPGNANITYDSDSLSLNVLPDFVFAQSDGTPFPAKLTGEKLYALYSPARPYVQISDLRGTDGGWRLSVSASSFTMDGIPALRGAKIRLLGGSAHSSNPGLSPVPVNSTITLDCIGQDEAPVVITDMPGGQNSMGAWVIRWYQPEIHGESAPVDEVGVELYVPPEAVALPGSYSATLYWTLSDAA